MKYYKDNKNNVYAYEDDAPKSIILKGLISITEAEALLSTAPPPLSLEEVKANKKALLNAECEAQIVGGFVSAALGSEYAYQSDLVDQLNLIGVVAGGVDDYFKCAATSAAPLVWSWEPHTIAELTQVLNDGKAYKQTLLQKVNLLKAQVDEALTSNDVHMINWA